MKEKISVILPTLNEAQNIGEVIEQCLKALEGETREILVVDDDSSDSTAQVVENLHRRFPEVQLIVRKNEKGLVKSIQEGIQKATGTYCLWMDADGSMSPSLIPLMLNELRQGADLVLGSRFIEGGAIKGEEFTQGKSPSFFRTWQNLRKSKDSFLSTMISKLGNWLMKKILTPEIHDYSSGYFAAPRHVLLDVGVEGRFVDYATNLPYKAYMRGYKIKEVPMRLSTRKFGTSKTSDSLKDILKIGFQCFFNAIHLRFTVLNQRSVELVSERQ